MPITPVGSAAAGSVTATTPTTPTPAPQTTAPPLQTPLGPSAAAAGQNAKKVTFTGLGAASMTASATTNRFARDTSFDNYTTTGNGPVGRGFVRAEATPIPGGCRLKLNSFHGSHNDSLTVWLLAEVLDKKTNQLRTITLSVLAQNANLNGTTYRGEHYFDLDYAEINKFLQARNPALQIAPGTTELAVAAQWSIGHQAGGFGRGGNFRLPMPQGQAQNVVSVRANTAVGSNNADLPLDMQVAYPAALETALPKLKRGGNVVSRLESELKGSSTKQEMLAAIKEAYRLAGLVHAGKEHEVEKILGKDWTIEPVSRYWLKDDGTTTQGSAGRGMFKGFRVDGDGFPMQDPMVDRYMDDGQLGMTRLEGAIRLRSNKAATGINVKPGGGRRDDKTSITQRIEVGLELEPNATVQDAATVLSSLASGQWSGTIFNHAQKQVRKLDQSLQLSAALQPWVDITQERHKFTVKNKVTGVEVELSLDKVFCKTLRPQHQNADGTAKEAEFYVLEAELDHLQLQSSNQSTYVSGTQVQSGAFTTDAQQDQWLKQTTPDVTMDIEPRLHEITDLDNESFRQTTSYRAFEGLSKKLLPALFPSGLQPGRQKAAQAAEAMGLVNFDPKKMKASLERFVEDAGFEWTPQLDQAADAAVADPVKRKAIDLALGTSGAAGVYNVVTQQLGANLLAYDGKRLKARIEGRLEALGYTSTPAIAAMVDKITTTNLPPQNLEGYLAQMAQRDDANVLYDIARFVGVAPAPVPTPSPAHLFTLAREAALATRLEQQSIDPAQAKEIMKFFEAAVAAGEGIYQIRAAIEGFHSASCEQVIQRGKYTGKAPMLRASVTALTTRADAVLKSQFVAVDQGVKDVLAKIAATRPLAAALQLASNLTVQGGAVLEREAKALGIPFTASYDWTAFDASFKPTLQAYAMQATPALATFLRSCFQAGVPAQTLTRVLQTASNGDLAAALRQNSVFIVGLTVPAITYDKVAAQQTITQRLGQQAPMFKKAWLDKTIDKMLDLGVAPTAISNYLSYVLAYGEAQALASAALPHLAGQLPAVELDADGIGTYLKARFGAQWTAAHEQYAKTALAAIVQKQNAIVGSITSWYYPSQVTAWLKQQSGIAAPPGV
ncbi:MAG: hypothetical protein IT381_12100 [Deltaproteobacteria bacterium]|nr:hypothetical protein [Deltaproteobacteria bacterium]